MLREAVAAMYDQRKGALDNIWEEIDRLIEYANDQLYDEEGEFQHEWSDCDKIRWERVIMTIDDARTGVYSIDQNIRGAK